MTTAPDKTALGRSTLLTFATYGASFLVPLLVTPYVIWRISLTGFGIWAALGTLALWLSRFDLGIANAVTRTVADLRARGEAEGIRRVGATWLWFDFAVGGALVALVALLGRPILRAVVPEGDPSALLAVLLAFAAQAALNPPLRHLNGTLYGLQKFNAVNLMVLVVTPLSVAGVVAALESGWGLLGLAANGVFFALVQVAAGLVVLARSGHALPLSPARFSRAELGRLVGFGWKLEATQLFMTALKSDRLILSATGGNLALLGVYQVGAGVVERISGAVTVLSTTLLTAVSDLAARGETDRIRSLLMRGTKYHALAAAGLLGFVALFAKEILVLWMGRPLPDAVAVIRIMTAGGYAAAVVSCAQAAGTALGRTGWQLAGAALGFLAAGFLYLGGARSYDYVGLAGAVSAGWALSQFLFMIGLHRHLKFSWREFAGNALLRPLAVAAPLAAVYAGWRILSGSLSPVESRAAALAVVGPAFAASAALSCLVARLSGVLDNYDMDFLKSVARARRPSPE